LQLQEDSSVSNHGGDKQETNYDISSSMKVIKREIRKVHAIHESKLPKSYASDHTRMRSPTRREEEDVDPAALMRARRKKGTGSLQNRILSKKAHIDKESIVIKGPKLVSLAAGYKYDFTGLLELCEIMNANTVLTALDISSNWIQPAGAKKLLGPSLKTCTGLLHLDLTCNDLRAPGMTALAPMIRELSGLKTLLLADNNISDTGATALAQALSVLTDLEALDLDANCISVEGIATLVPPLKRLSQLQSLNLSGNVTHFSQQSSEGPAFMECLMPCLFALTHLTHLGLASNVLLTGGAKWLARVLGDLRHTLVSLDLGGRFSAHNRIGSGGMKVLSAGLFWTPLVVLDMSFNELGTDGTDQLALVLSIHTSLTEISLRGNGMGTTGVRPLMSSLIKHQRLRSLDLADNDINSDALKYICEAVVQLTALVRLSLAHNRLVAASGTEVITSAVNYDGMDMLTKVLITSNLAGRLEALDLKEAGLDQRALRGMVEVVKTMTSLQQLNGLHFNPSATNMKLPPRLDNYELLYVSQRLQQIETLARAENKAALERCESAATQRVSDAKKIKVDVTDFTWIDLSGCGFLEFPGVLARLRNLREIDLCANPIIRVPIRTVMDFASLHDIILKDCALLLHPPRGIAAKGQVVEYLRECKLCDNKIALPLIVAGESDEIIGTFVTSLKALETKEPTPRVHMYKPHGTSRDQSRGKGAEALPAEIRWSPAGSKHSFSVIQVTGTARSSSCTPFIQVQRAVNLFALRTSGPVDRADLLSYLDMLYAYNCRSVVALLIVHDGSALEDDVAHRFEYAVSVMEQWKKKLSPNQPSLSWVQEPVLIDTSKPECLASLGETLYLASHVLLAPEGDWVHPIVVKMEDHLAHIAQVRVVRSCFSRGRFSHVCDFFGICVATPRHLQRAR